MVRIKKILSILLPLFLFLSAKGQDNGEKEDPFSRARSIRSSATISPAFFSAPAIDKGAFLHGFLEYFPESRVSLRGDSFWFFSEEGDEGAFFHQNFSSVFGAMLHLQKGRFDPYLGLQTGVDLSVVNLGTFGKDGNDRTERIVSPLFVPSAGVNYFVGKHFNFFGHFLYTNGRIVNRVPSPVNLDSFRISFGLGFNLSLLQGAEQDKAGSD